MNEAVPRWRSFTSAAVEPQPDPAPTTPGRPSVGEIVARPVVVLLSAVLGGAAAGAAVALLGVAILGDSGPGQGLTAPGWVGVAPADAARLGQGGVAAGASTATQAGLGIVVDIAGAVVRPGILRLHEGDRVADAIEAAGGYGPRADLDAAARSLNLAQPLADGSKVVVPELGMDPALAGLGGQGVGGSGIGDLIDLNSADQAALESLPGIGPVTAGKIMAARDERPFSAVEDLLERGLVGDAVYEDIADQVGVGG